MDFLSQECSLKQTECIAKVHLDNAYYNNVVVDCSIYLLSNYDTVGSTLTPPVPNTNFTSIEGTSTETRYAVRLANVYPTSIDSIQLSWSEEATMRINLTLTYSNWEPIVGASAHAHIIVHLIRL